MRRQGPDWCARPGEIADLLDALAAGLHREDHREDANGHGEVDRHEDHDAFDARDRAGREAHQRVAHIADGGIGHQALDVPLADAAKAPSAIEAIATKTMIGCQSFSTGRKPSIRMRTVIATAAIFGAVATKAATGVGAPS